jgi:hypothetical protein
MLKKVLLLAVAGAAIGSAAAHAGVMGTRDAFTDGAKIAATADAYAYSVGARAAGRHDVYTDGARITNRDGLVGDASHARITNRDGLVDDSSQR